MQLGAHINQFGVIGMVQGHADQSVTGTVLAPAHVPGTPQLARCPESAAADASAGDPDEGLYWPAPGGNARCAYCPSPTTTHSKEKRLLSMSKPRRTLNRNA